MTAAAINDRSAPTMRTRLAWVLSGIAILFLGVDAGAEILVPTLMAAFNPLRG